MKYYLLIISLFVVFACDSESKRSNKSISNDLIDNAIGKYHGSIKHSSKNNSKSCFVEVTKLSSEQIQINASDCMSKSIKLLLDKSKSTSHSMIFRNREGRVIARCMGKTFDYQLPLPKGNTESFNGIKEEEKR